MLKPNWFTQSVYIAIVAIALICFRVVLMVVIPLMDKTEARYAEIARIMQETQNWVVLHINYDTPFWGKPPLSTWSTALSFELFGVTEWAARLPSFLISLLIIVILYQAVKKTGASWYLMAFILMTMPQFLLHAGVVSTDTTFAICVIMVMLCYWNTQTTGKFMLWSYGFFVFIGLGLLAKGPVVLALTIPPLAIWSWLQKQRSRLILSRLPWVTGLLLTSLIALPWYFLVEYQSPGFISYFIVGEHLGRFLEPSWQGDLYGFAKSAPKGTIWLFLLISAFPWGLLVFYWLWKNKAVIKYSSWVIFLTIWLCWIPVFFTFSSNISHTYVLPALAPMAMLSVIAWKDMHLTLKRALLVSSALLPLMALVVFLTAYLPGKLQYRINSDKYLLSQAEATCFQVSTPIYYWKEIPYSGQFYSKGKAKAISRMSVLNDMITIDKRRFYLIVSNHELEKIQQQHLFKLLDNNDKNTLLLYQGDD